MFHLIFSVGNNDCPQEAMSNIRDKNPNIKLTTTSVLYAWTLPKKMDQVERLTYILQLSTKLILIKLFSNIV